MRPTSLFFNAVNDPPSSFRLLLVIPILLNSRNHQMMLLQVRIEGALVND
jgi:hypothetical protein